MAQRHYRTARVNGLLRDVRRSAYEARYRRDTTLTRYLFETTEKAWRLHASYEANLCEVSHQSEWRRLLRASAYDERAAGISISAMIMAE